MILAIGIKKSAPLHMYLITEKNRRGNSQYIACYPDTEKTFFGFRSVPKGPSKTKDI